MNDMHNEDEKIQLPVSFLRKRTILFVDALGDTPGTLDETSWKVFSHRLKGIGYTLTFLPDLVKQLSPELLRYMSPGQRENISVEDMYRRIQDLAGLLYKQRGGTYFRVIPTGSLEDLIPAFDAFIKHLKDLLEEDVCSIRFSKSGLSEDSDFFKSSCASHRIVFKREASIPEPIQEDTPDPKSQAIIKAWEEIERKFGITIEDLDILLGYRVKLSRLHITTSGRILLPDYEGKEVKMDDLTKAVYFFYLRHPEGARLKELQDYKKEILHYYLGITGRDDVREIRKSVQKFLDPYGNSLNVSFSRIKKAFKDIVGDRIARFYYIDGRYAETRKIALDRDLVIWDH